MIVNGVDTEQVRKQLRANEEAIINSMTRGNTVSKERLIRALSSVIQDLCDRRGDYLPCVGRSMRFRSYDRLDATTTLLDTEPGQVRTIDITVDF
jgi:hypothetical protein